MTKKSKNSQLSLLDVALIVFVILKLTGDIDWSWGWVLSPLWITIGCGILVNIYDNYKKR